MPKDSFRKTGSTIKKVIRIIWKIGAYKSAYTDATASIISSRNHWPAPKHNTLKAGTYGTQLHLLYHIHPSFWADVTNRGESFVNNQISKVASSQASSEAPKAFGKIAQDSYAGWQPPMRTLGTKPSISYGGFKFVFLDKYLPQVYKIRHWYVVEKGKPSVSSASSCNLHCISMSQTATFARPHTLHLPFRIQKDPQQRMSSSELLSHPFIKKFEDKDIDLGILVGSLDPPVNLPG
ncbi:hypothetical protein M5K25_017977 [Dendrobium thyrsiflorum]|uniref:Uncharacterized protein n=1 Tax=Dendrobium thyrsiflorum TaxID=117978 RepID=A0ABD0UH17_DENTH